MAIDTLSQLQGSVSDSLTRVHIPRANAGVVCAHKNNAMRAIQVTTIDVRFVCSFKNYNTYITTTRRLSDELCRPVGLEKENESEQAVFQK